MKQKFKVIISKNQILDVFPSEEAFFHNRKRNDIVALSVLEVSGDFYRLSGTSHEGSEYIATTGEKNEVILDGEELERVEFYIL